MVATPSQRYGRWLGTITACAGALILFRFIAPAIPLDPIVAYLFGFAAVVGQTLLVAALTPQHTPRQLPWFLLAAAILIAIRVTESYGVMCAVAVTASLLCIGTALGAAVGRAIEHPGHVLYVALVSSFADAFSVYSEQGLSAAIVASKPTLSVLALSWPMLGTDRIAQLLGVGDVVFTALYVGVARKHALSIPRTLVALTVGYAMTAATVVVTQVPIAALPFLGAAILLAHPQARKPTPKDALRGGIGTVLLLGVLALFLIFR
jgi:hypothetical protein